MFSTMEKKPLQNRNATIRMEGKKKKRKITERQPWGTDPQVSGENANQVEPVVHVKVHQNSQIKTTKS